MNRISIVRSTTKKNERTWQSRSLTRSGARHAVLLTPTLSASSARDADTPSGASGARTRSKHETPARRRGEPLSGPPHLSQRFALYPHPPRCAGWRLCHLIMGLTETVVPDLGRARLPRRRALRRRRHRVRFRRGGELAPAAWSREGRTQDSPPRGSYYLATRSLHLSLAYPVPVLTPAPPGCRCTPRTLTRRVP